MPVPDTAPNLPRRLLRWSALLLLALGVALTFDLIRQVSAVDRVAWQPPPGAAVSADGDRLPAGLTAPGAFRPGRPALLRFTSDACGACRMMVVEVFSRKDVADRIEADAAAYSVDLTRSDAEAIAWARHYGAIYTPTLLMLDASGREVARLDRAVDAAAFDIWFGDALTRARVGR